MVVLTSDGKRRLRRPSLKGGVMMDVVNGQERVRSWPKPRGKALSEGTKEQNEWFRQAQAATKYMSPDQMFAAMAATKGTPLLPRDILTMMMSGRMLAFHLQNGKTVWPEVAKMDVSKSLDIISQTPGYMLIRGDDAWEGIPYTPAGGGGLWYYNPPDPADFPALLTGFAAVITEEAGAGTLIKAPQGAHSGAEGFAGMMTPTPLIGGSWRVEQHSVRSMYPSHPCGFGLLVANAAQTKAYMLEWDARQRLEAASFNLPYGYGGSEWYWASDSGGCDWFAFEWDDAVNALHFEASGNGLSWRRLLTIDPTGFLGGKPAFVGPIIYGQANGPEQEAGMLIDCWVQSW